MDKEKTPQVLWDEGMSVGLEEMDEDHRRLVELINRLSGAKDIEDAALVEQVLDELLDYTVVHFAREEAYMRAVGFPLMDEHCLMHAKLTRKVEEIRLDYFLGKRECLGAETLQFLKDWLCHHILVEDMKYNPQSQPIHTGFCQVPQAAGRTF